MRAACAIAAACALLALAPACLAEDVAVPPSAAAAQPPPGGEACDSVRLQPAGADRCAFVKANCRDESLIPYLRLYYCYATPAGPVARVALQALLVLLVLLIFRLLGSTAENFFSPILTQISQDLGLPPRFAGVTLLALGNGAPDLVSSIAFVRAGKYRVALGGLLGGGMFVGAAVAGVVIWTAGGVKARGALMRDVSAYICAVGVVAAILAAGSVTWALAALLLGLYLLFVAVVLAADLLHLRRHGFRRPGEEPKQEEQPLLREIAAAPIAELEPPCSASITSIELVEGRSLEGGRAHASEPAGRALSHTNSAGQDSIWSADGLSYSERLHMSGRAYRQMALAEVARSGTFFGGPDAQRARRLALLREDPEEGGSGGGYSPPRLQSAFGDGAARPPGNEEAGGCATPAKSSPASELEERRSRVEQWCALGPGGQPSAELPPGLQARRSSSSILPQELWPAAEAARSLWAGAKAGAQGLGLLLAAAEYPFVLLRRVTIPLVDADSYDRRWLAAAFAGMPLAVCWYFGVLSPRLALPLALGLGVCAAAASWRCSAPGQAPEWGCGLRFPLGAACVAALGFCVSAMWIDTIAGELVALLDYFGTLSGVPHEVLGLTVLAWGNSVGDLSTNTAMARRGLSNMAMTACFAGPIINLLVALGLGFLRFLAAHGLRSTPVQLVAMDLPSIVMVAVNGACLLAVGALHGGWVPGWYGVVPLVLYALYIAVSLAVAFG